VIRPDSWEGGSESEVRGLTSIKDVVVFERFRAFEDDFAMLACSCSSIHQGELIVKGGQILNEHRVVTKRDPNVVDLDAFVATPAITKEQYTCDFCSLWGDVNEPSVRASPDAVKLSFDKEGRKLPKCPSAYGLTAAGINLLIYQYKALVARSAYQRLDFNVDGVAVVHQRPAERGQLGGDRGGGDGTMKVGHAASLLSGLTRARKPKSKC
jgi:hypothetical protein